MIIAIKAQIQIFYNRLLNILLPPCCPGCGELTSAAHLFCSVCWPKIQLIQKPYCNCCGVPMPYDNGDLTCLSCLRLSPDYDKGRSALQYEGLARNLVLKLKHGDATYLPASLSTWMMQAGYEFWADTDYLIPVPLHRWRLFRRGYNQATLLAKSLSKRVQIPLLTNIVIRKKATESQGFKTRRQRYENVQGAFALKDPNGLLKNKTITLIDDVWTTGATMAACINVLKQGGVKTVYVLTLARVIKES